MNKTVKKVWNIAATVLVVIIVILAILLAAVRIFGLMPFAVLSGSMEPEYSTGDLIYVKSVDTDSLVEGDIITYVEADDTIVTHRVVAINLESDGDRSFTTKGDANDSEDRDPVHEKNVIGKPVFSIPLLGYLSYVILTPPWTYVSIGVGAILIFLIFLPDVLFGNDKKKKDEDKKNNKEEVPADDPDK